MNAYGVELAGDLLFVANKYGGMIILDISDSLSPVLRVEFEDTGKSMFVKYFTTIVIGIDKIVNNFYY